jgi:hypothetical protein
MIEETLEPFATLALPDFDEVTDAEEERLALIAEELREAIRRKVGPTD